MNIPNEVVVEILSFLGKADLKSARCVSKTWCCFASDFLFDQIYISANPVDLDIFEAISKHPTLRHCVRHLIYDLNVFDNQIQKRRYYYQEAPRRRPFTLDSEVCEWLNEDEAEATDRKPQRDLLTGKCLLLEQGYRKYQEYARQAQRVMDSGKLAITLLRGLGQFNKLTSVQFGYLWDEINLGGPRKGMFVPPSACSRELQPRAPYNLPFNVLTVYIVGSPLVRSWDPFVTRPNTFFNGDGQEASKNGVRHFQILTRALSAADKKPKTLIFKGLQDRDYTLGLRNVLFDRGIDLGHDFVQLIASISGVERFELDILAMSVIGRNWSHVDERPPIEGLASLLGSMSCLKHLVLVLPEPFGFHTLDTVDKVFPKVNSWVSLETLRLDNTSTSAGHLLHLFTVQMPNLKNLQLGETLLGEGTWRNVFEALAQSKQLRCFSIDRCSLLVEFDHETEDFEEVIPKHVRRHVENFVTGAGGNPYLFDNEECLIADAELDFR